MDGSNLFERLDARLRAAHLPADYRRRVLRELCDHAEEILSEAAERPADPAEAERVLAERLGPPERVAEEFIRSYRLRSLAGRHPILTFGIAPLFTALVAWAVIQIVFMAALTRWIDPYSLPLKDVFFQSASGLTLWMLCHLPPLAIAAMFAALAHRTAWGWRGVWGIAALGLLFGFLHGELQWPMNGPGTGHLRYGVGWPPDFVGLTGPLLIASTVLAWLRFRSQFTARTRDGRGVTSKS
jgi:hypothetical protein